jgi:hypothetical protein
MKESDEDRLIGEWHELARSVESGAHIDLPAAVGALSEVLRRFAPTLRRPQDEGPILPFMAETRQLEKSWNMELGKALIDAREALKRDEPSDGVGNFG